jgi:hypothetical protein
MVFVGPSASRVWSKPYIHLVWKNYIHNDLVIFMTDSKGTSIFKWGLNH